MTAQNSLKKLQKYLRRELEEFGCEKFAEVLFETLTPTIWLKRIRGKPQLGQSKIGGEPDLPPKMKWPCSKNEKKPMTFLAQINLEQLPHQNVENPLPIVGLLFFFGYWKGEDSRIEEGKILYYPDKPVIKGTVKVPNEDCLLAEVMKLDPRVIYNVPNFEAPLWEKLEVGHDGISEAIDCFSDAIQNDDIVAAVHESHNLMLGEPVVIQGDILNEAAESFGQNREKACLLIQLSDAELALPGIDSNIFFCVSLNNIKMKKFSHPFVHGEIS